MMFWVIGAVAGVCVIVILGAIPELLAATLTAAFILTPYYTLTERHHTMTATPEPIQYGTLTLESRDGKPYLVTAPPLPEYIEVAAELWDEAWDNRYDEHADGPARPIWLEPIGHADPEIDNDGYVLHIEASNAWCNYRLLTEREDGTRSLVFQSSGEY